MSKKISSFILTLLLTPFCFGYELHKVSFPQEFVGSKEALEALLSDTCPSVAEENISARRIIEAQKAGKFGGSLGNVVGNNKVSRTEFATPLANNTRALLLDAAYYTNKGGSQILVLALGVRGNGNQALVDVVDITLEQDSAESILICFDADEKPELLGVHLNNKKVDGSRPTMGVIAWTTNSSNITPLD